MTLEWVITMACQKRQKSRDQKNHARMRLRTRCGVEGSRTEIDNIINDITDIIQSGKAKHIEKQSNRVALFEVKYKGDVYFPVYDHVRKLITTFLTEEMVANNSFDEDA